MSEKTKETLFNELRPIEAFNEVGDEDLKAVVEALFDAGGYETLAALQAAPPSKDDLREMEIKKIFLRNAVIAAFSAPVFTSPAPPTATTDDPNDLDALFDGEVKEITWAKIKLLAPAAIDKLVADFFADPKDKRRAGYRFMVAVRQGSGRGPVAKLKGKPSQEGTAKMINALAIDRARFDGNIFVAGPNEMYLSCSIEDMDKSIAKRDVLDPEGSFLQEGTGVSWMGVRLYSDDWSDFVLAEEVQVFLAYAQKIKELTREVAMRISDSIRGREANVTIEDVRWHLQRAYRDIYVVGVEDLPELEGEYRPNFSQSTSTDEVGEAVDTSELQRMLDEIMQNLPIGQWQHAVDFMGEQWEIYMWSVAPRNYRMKFSRTGMRDQPIEILLKVEYLDRYFDREPEWYITTTEFINALYSTLKPIWSEAVSQAPVGLPSPTLIRDELCRLFNDDELRTLCVDLGVDYESLPGDGKASKARELVAYMQRQERTSELVNTVKRQRSHAKWEMHL